jgi:hypothetical protein
MKNKWFIAIKKNSGDLFDTSSFVKIESPKGKYYADPFIVKHKGVNYLFFEDYDYKKGVISYSIINDDLTITPPTKVLEEPFHLSFPNIFKEDGNFYMIPEKGDTGEVTLYKSTTFPNKWEPVKNIIKNIRTSDIEIFKHNNIYWLFTTHGANLDDSLLIMYSDSLLGDWSILGVDDIPHSRPAGKIFNCNGKIIRPVQDCTKLYGYGLVFKSMDVSKEGYDEEIIHRINPDWYPEIIGTHTFNHNEDYIVIDGKIKTNE